MASYTTETTSRARDGDVTKIPLSEVVVTILAANPVRQGATIENMSLNRDLYLKFDPGASLTDFSIIVPARTMYELPFGYSGIITGLWDGSGAGDFAQVTELT